MISQLDTLGESLANRLVVCWGVGQDSSGLLVGMIERGIIPWKIVFSDVGNEKRGTYEFKPVFEDYLAREGMPAVNTVRYVPKNFKHWPKYYTLLENCLTNVTLPSLAYGFHTCSSKWKIAAINRYLKTHPDAQIIWRKGGRIDKAIGFDASPWERQRAARGCQTFAIQTDERDRYRLVFPLQDWGWQREDCVAALQRHGLPVPPKSSCFFCPAMKPAEVETLDEQELKVIVILEWRVAPRHLARAEADGWPLGVGVPKVEGLWRKPVLGKRGATPKPGSMTEYIRAQGLLPADEITRLQERTTSALFSRFDFEKLGFITWQDWLEDIMKPAREEDNGQLILI